MARGSKTIVRHGCGKAVDLGLSVKWANCNVGATSPEKYGGYYTWEEGKKMVRTKWGGSWRMPTSAEQRELNEKCTWTWTKHNGVAGMKVTGPNGNSIFLPAAGYRDGAGVHGAGTLGDVWSGTLDEIDSGSAYGVEFDSGGSHYWDSSWARRYGLSVRPVE